MKYANFCDTSRQNINIGDYLQFIATNYLYNLANIPQESIVYLGFKDIASYDGEEVIFPFCYSFIDFVVDGKIAISNKIIPIFFSVTLSTIDKFINLNTFFSSNYNRTYLLKYAPIGCRDEITYNILNSYNIPAYINGCMTAIFPQYSEKSGKKVLFIDAPKALLPYIPESFFNEYEIFTQQYHFNESDIKNYQKIFKFVNSIYDNYKQTAKIAITSRLHVALPLAAFGIPVILAKDQIDGRFSFIEKYFPIYQIESYDQINWNPSICNFEEIKKLLKIHALGRIQCSINNIDLKNLEQKLTDLFRSRTVTSDYRNSHIITHKNGYRFEEYSKKYWNNETPIEYAFWGVSENNSDYWKKFIETKYSLAKLVAVYDSFRDGELFGIPIQRPEKIKDGNIYIIVCSVGAAEAAIKLFKKLNIDKSRYCITSDCFISKEDIEEMRIKAK